MVMYNNWIKVEAMFVDFLSAENIMKLYNKITVENLIRSCTRGMKSTGSASVTLISYLFSLSLYENISHGFLM
mgnify:CR=1 FL=1